MFSGHKEAEKEPKVCKSFFNSRHVQIFAKTIANFSFLSKE